MGRDKALLELGGRPLLQRVVEPVSRLCEEVIIAGADNPVQRLPGLSPIWVSDPPGAVGPLAGLSAGLAAASHPTTVVVACDMPFLSERLLGHLLDIVKNCDAAVPFAGGDFHPLHAAYSRSCLPTVDSLLRLGVRSMRGLLPRLHVKYLGEDHCMEFDPDGLSWFNMNTADDFRLARNHWARQQNRVAAA
jgi:molybdopterin-guanine dinucleotide biosynthesis protein A